MQVMHDPLFLETIMRPSPEMQRAEFHAIDSRHFALEYSSKTQCADPTPPGTHRAA
jgi:hypothetical protein